jgi:hypothetical protein
MKVMQPKKRGLVHAEPIVVLESYDGMLLLLLLLLLLLF